MKTSLSISLEGVKSDWDKSRNVTVDWSPSAQHNGLVKFPGSFRLNPTSTEMHCALQQTVAWRALENFLILISFSLRFYSTFIVISCLRDLSWSLRTVFSFQWKLIRKRGIVPVSLRASLLTTRTWNVTFQYYWYYILERLLECDLMSYWEIFFNSHSFSRDLDSE